VDVTDALGRTVRLEAPPRRIVSLVPSLTELLASLDLDDETVGLTRFCVHPADWKAKKQIVGGTKNVRVDRVEALAPDLVLASKEENEREQVEAVARFAPVYVTDIASVEDSIREIRTVGQITDRSAQAEALARRAASGFAALEADAPAEPIRAAYLIWREPWMAAGGDTYVSDVMRRAGFANVFASQDRYPTVALSDLTAADVVLLSSEPYPFADEHVGEVEAAASGTHAVLADGEAFSWYGARTAEAPGYLRALRERLAR
jgi:ABC-type Fe3+-hydroxamate transport system substrate-binding protein